jgi:hypothetical protein
MEILDSRQVFLTERQDPLWTGLINRQIKKHQYIYFGESRRIGRINLVLVGSSRNWNQ